MKKIISALAALSLFVSINANAYVATSGVTKQPGGGSGTITGVTAGTGCSGGGSSGNVTINCPGVSPTNTIANGLTGASTPQGALKNLMGQPPLYVANYGAKTDGLRCYDGVVTISPNTVSSTCHPFVSADVGKTISIIGAGYDRNTTATASTTANSLTSVGTIANIVNGASAYGSCVSAGTTVSLVGASTVYLSAIPTSSGTCTFDFVRVLTTTVTSVSGGVATIAATPGYANSAAQFVLGTDDTAVVQSVEALALAAGPSTHVGLGQLFFPLGQTILSGSIPVDGNISFTGLGAGKSVVVLANTADLTNGLFNTTQDISLASTGCTPALAAPWHDNSFTNFEIDESFAFESGIYAVQNKGINLFCATRSVVDHMYIHDTPATSVATDDAIGTIVTNNTLANCGRLAGNGVGGNCIGDGVDGMIGESYVFANNIIINPAHDGILLESESTTTNPVTAEITGNVIYAGGNSQPAGGTNLQTAGIDVAGSMGANVTGNAITGSGQLFAAWNCIGLDGGTVNKAAPTSTLVSSNRCYQTQNGIYATFGSETLSVKQKYLFVANSIEASVAAGVIIQGNTSIVSDDIAVLSNIISGSGNAGIAVGNGIGTINHLVINGNLTFDNGQTTASAYRQAGISFAAGTYGNLVATNNVSYDDGAGFQNYGIAFNTGATATNANLSGNTLRGNITAPLLTTGATLTGATIVNNPGLNPIGPKTVAVTASPMTYTALTSPEYVSIMGGTVTGVTVGGITVCTASPCYVPLAPGQAFIDTYTVAPTMSSSVN